MKNTYAALSPYCYLHSVILAASFTHQNALTMKDKVFIRSAARKWRRNHLINSGFKLVFGSLLLAFIWTSFFPIYPLEDPMTLSSTSVEQIQSQLTNTLHRTEAKGNHSIDLINAPSLQKIDPTYALATGTCDDRAYFPKILHGNRYVHVSEPMEEVPARTNEVFFMLNGQNDGLYISYNEKFECIHAAAAFAAISLGADANLLGNGVRLYSQIGFPILNTVSLKKANRIVHILLDYQLWTWPGIRIGYKYKLESGVVLTTIGLSPKVFDVENFFTAKEGARIIEEGSIELDQDNENQGQTYKSAFLRQSRITENFQRRGAQITRSPSPSFVETLHLVRYGVGDLYRQHLDVLQSREFVPARWNAFTYNDFAAWALWAGNKIQHLGVKVPQDFNIGGRFFPALHDVNGFHLELLNLFRRQASKTNFFLAHLDEAWDEWLAVNINRHATDIISILLAEGNRPEYLPFIVKAWERAVALPELRYTFPPKQVNGLSHYYNWIRWAKERISFYDDSLPKHVRPGSRLYPSYLDNFQTTLLGYVLEDYDEQMINRLTDDLWYDWLITNRAQPEVLGKVLQTFSGFVKLVIRSWEARAQIPKLRYTIPPYVKDFQPQRYATLSMYLSDEAIRGGETVFPYSADHNHDTKIQSKEMPECSTGLVVRSRALHATLFYSQTPEDDIDNMSIHADCPLEEGTKWVSNLFMWNANADEGALLW
uniref:Uncharacterized protein AlNc14C15G1714 n=1 Tax=Albugo laibachii Nc14 TaxID=890382 RepID=F0W427_9STRA|nr:conserved hypothetical protein [Albugo laibachii Nc14]|eukprot:CCA15824.1 conserved hypothetical protein [Albugo laibachii Nc14]